MNYDGSYQNKRIWKRDDRWLLIGTVKLYMVVKFDYINLDVVGYNNMQRKFVSIAILVVHVTT
jgi:hypothetical protein